MRDETLLLLANRAWAAQLKDERPDYFERHAAEQKPNFLWIGCSDSRVAPDQITNSPPGVMSIHRNVANLVYEADGNLMAVLQVALEKTKVRHIILCGHYGCGGVGHGLDGDAAGSLGEWVRSVGDIADRHVTELQSLDAEERLDRLVEINVREQLARLSRLDVVQAAFRRGQPLTLHGWVYDLRDGILKPLAEIEGAAAETAEQDREPVSA